MDTENIEKLKALVQSGQVRMMTIDTSIFRQHGLALRRGLLGQLAQFKDSRFSLILSEIVVREIRRQSSESLENDLKGWPKISRRLKGISKVASTAADMEKALADLVPSDIANHEVDQFLVSTGADVITANHAEMDRVLDLYFNYKPPFGPDGKRNEFPDAIALLGIEEWCRAAECGIIVVSADKDWKRFCEQSDSGHLYLIDDLAIALEIVNASAAEREVKAKARQDRLLERVGSGELVPEIQRQLRRLLMDRGRPVGDSYLDYVADIVRIEVGNLSFSNPGRIRDDDAGFVVLMDMQATCTFWAQFTFYNLEAKEVTKQLGKGVYGYGQDIEAAILLTAEADTVSVEVLLKEEKLVINFGKVEPDEDGTESHTP